MRKFSKVFFSMLMVMALSLTNVAITAYACEMPEEYGVGTTESVARATSTDGFIWNRNTTSVTVRLTFSLIMNNASRHKSYTGVAATSSGASSGLVTFYFTNSSGSMYPMTFRCNGGQITEMCETSIPAGTYTVTMANVSPSNFVLQSLVCNFLNH